MLWRHAVVIVGVLAFLARAAHAQEGFNGICASAFADKAITLAQRYVREFDVKWLRGEANEPLLGSGDIQSLADLGNAHQAVRAMSIVPVTKAAIVELAVATLAPVAPLLLTMMPLEELLKTMLGILL